MEIFSEIWETIRRHKLRTAITGFSVGWGIFLLVVLLAVGNGLGNGVAYQFRDDAINSIWISPGTTMIPYKGMPKGRSIRFTDEDYDLLKERMPEIESISGRIEKWGAQYVTRGSVSAGFSLRGLHPGHRAVENTQLVQGRYINDADIEESRKVTCIGEPIADFFFSGEDPIGKTLNVNGIIYTVVGVFFDAGGDRENRMLHIPVSTAQLAYNESSNLHRLLFTIKDASLEKSREMEIQVRKLLGAKHNFDYRDPRAINVRNNFEEFVKYNDLIVFITYFVGFVGLMTLIAGVVGVGNILLITVKERTKEFGVRRAIGANAFSIISLILLESISITLFSGYLGLLAGVGLIEGVNAAFPDMSGVFNNPSIDISVAVGALLVLVVTGALTGVLPALRAVRINPIEALRAE